MNKVSDRSTTTVVKIFINTCTIMSFMSAPLVAHADPPPATTSTATTPAVPGGFTFGGENPDVAKARLCKDYSDDHRDAAQKVADACRKAGLGGKECVENARTCGDATEEDDFSLFDTVKKTASSYFPALAGSADVISGDRNKACPQMSGRDYFENKERIEKELKQAKEDIAKLDEERASAKEEYDDAMSKIQEDLAKAQKDAKDKGAEIDEDTQKQLAEFQTAQAQAAKDMRSKKTDVLSLQGELIALDRSKATALLDLTNFMATKQCKREMLEAYTAYKTSVSAGSNSSHVARSSSKKQELIQVYNRCMDGFSQKRANVSESFKRQRDLLENRITNSNADVNAIEDGLKDAKAGLEKLQSIGDGKKSAELQAVIDQGTRAQSEMEAAYTQMQTKNSGIAKKETALNEELNRLNAELATLGPMPERGTEYAPKDALADIENGMTEMEDIEENIKSCPGGEAMVKKMQKRNSGRQ